ncbi:MAG: toll/interleukin-1 receptor domain-containing protein, partial [Chloroflexi bacterium]|nr:toll/interleukin-1 receptor domain-containing protein [Chloroflexota bacterium]
MVNESSSVLWTPGRFRLFLSHISAEKAYVAAVKAELAEHEVDGFVAHEDIEPTRDWQDTIELALHECQALVALLHPRFHESLWTDQEVGFARSRGVLVIPVRLGLDPYGFIGRYQGLPGAESPVELARSIVDVLISHELTSPAMGQSVVRALETAPSYAAARVRVAHAGNYAH